MKESTFPIGDQLKEWFKDWIKSEEGQAVLGEAIEELFDTNVSDKGRVILCKVDKNGFIKLPLESGTYTKVEPISILGLKGGDKQCKMQ